MTANPELAAERKIPTRADSLIFRAKTFLLQIRRHISDSRTGVTRFQASPPIVDKPVIATSSTPLWTENDERERILVAGKIHNLRVATRRLDGVQIPAGHVFSFWKHVRRTTRLRGYVAGRELREGCIIPNIGGGLCQLSNALYDAALQANCEIVERHAHTQVIPGSLAEQGRDATVFWNYVDLRFRPRNAVQIEVKLDSNNLIVRFRGAASVEKPVHQIRRVVDTPNPNSCATCETGDCHRVVDRWTNVDFGRTAYLVDEHAPEFDAYIQESRSKDDSLMMPLDGRRFRKGNYAWTTSGFASVRQSLFTTAKRSYRSRKLSAQGAARQLNLLRMYRELAESYGSRLTFDVTHVVVHQNLLPFLWKSGQLGGRTFDVLMSALPMHEIQKHLDDAYRLHPESKTLGDFRADPDLVSVEREALREARKIVTTHTAIASLFPNRAELLEWKMPDPGPRTPGTTRDKPVIVFPASTVGRKGCYELREALRNLDAKLLLLGPVIEDSGFWSGFDAERGPDNWSEIADLVVLPAFVEHKPRRLLFAAARGIPVIATSSCGVDGVPNVTTVPLGEASALREVIVEHIGKIVR